MRNREFRVWNGKNMEYNITVGKFGAFYVNPGSDGRGLDPNDSASLTPFNTRYPDETPVMEFTGLVDKNGTKIYEGDITITRTLKVANKEGVGLGAEIKSIVSFNPYFGWNGIGRIDRIEREIEEVEVIRNIYELSEIL